MAQISKGDTFTDGQQVTGARLNQLVDSSVLLVGAITDQPSITANTLQATDTTIVNDAGVLKEATIGDFLNSNLPVTTSSITAGNTSDIVITPNDGTIVTGQAYTSGDGLTVTVTSTAHILAVGQIILVTAAGTGYNGTFRVATVATNSFTYVMTTAATAGGGSLSYTKKGLVKNPANESVAGNLYVDGTSVVASSYVAGNQIVAGNSAVTGNLAVTGTATFNNAPQVLTSVIKPRFDYFVQTRTQTTISSGWGGNQNTANLYGTKITALDLTFTPQKVGNKVLLTWTIFGEFNDATGAIFLVTRTPNSGVGSGVAVALPDAVDATNNTWSGVSTSYDNDVSSTPNVFTVKILDDATLDVSCTYSVHVRSSYNGTTTLYLNRSVTSAGAALYESGLSLGHAHEIYT
jgi:hypothetical protein